MAAFFVFVSLFASILFHLIKYVEKLRKIQMKMCSASQLKLRFLQNGQKVYVCIHTQFVYLREKKELAMRGKMANKKCNENRSPRPNTKFYEFCAANALKVPDIIDFELIYRKSARHEKKNYNKIESAAA